MRHPISQERVKNDAGAFRHVKSVNFRIALSNAYLKGDRRKNAHGLLDEGIEVRKIAGFTQRRPNAAHLAAHLVTQLVEQLRGHARMLREEKQGPGKRALAGLERRSEQRRYLSHDGGV